MPGEDFEELEIIRHRFEGFEKELEQNQDKVNLVNQLASQLLQAEYVARPEQIEQRQKQLVDRWNDLLRLVDTKRGDIKNAYNLQQFFIESQETITWINDKMKLVESTDELGL